MAVKWKVKQKFQQCRCRAELSFRTGINFATPRESEIVLSVYCDRCGVMYDPETVMVWE